ncbi:dihydropyrimidinase [Peptoniphilus equinus]|uniref:Dihydropyrimidinase n=1 Tax=Peptoniphilus equinus TaxID=3016343 RepID=A0ABY7QUL7_9FIRM|nr:dihydropyrimidinase [Peptoniphilus equinus]WBW49868.1 dihydropyrimidinase [Peptoniphilus equinus]
MRTLLKNGIIVTADNQVQADLLMEDEKIIGIGTYDDADKVYDVSGMYVMPGGIDPHTHMELQQSERYRSADDFYTGTVAAAVGGTTTILDHIAFGPEGAALHHSIDIYRELAKKSVIDYGFHGVIQHVDDEILNELDGIITEEGIVSFKAYSTYGYAMDDIDFYRILKQMKQSGGLLTIHCENDLLTRYLIREAVDAGHTDVKYFPATRPNEAEAESVDTLLNLAKLVETPVYIVHTSATESVERIKLAKAMGQEVYSETCTQYLMLTEAVYSKDGPEEGVKYLMQPPLRTAKDNEALWRALQDGDVVTLGTDHCPFMYETEKRQGLGNFTLAPGGAPGVEERIKIAFSEGVLKRRLDLNTFVNVVSTNAAKIFGMYPEKGSLELNTDADVMVIDPNGRETISVKTHHSVCDYNTYEGFTVNCAIHLVFSRGTLVAKDGTFVGEKGYGRFIHRKNNKQL